MSEEPLGSVVSLITNHEHEEAMSEKPLGSGRYPVVWLIARSDRVRPARRAVEVPPLL